MPPAAVVTYGKRMETEIYTRIFERDQGCLPKYA